MKQPRVPEYREADGVKVYIKSLILFLKDFTLAAWAANNQRKKDVDAVKTIIQEMPEIKYPVTSVNKKTGDVSLSAKDVGALEKDAQAADSAKLGGADAKEYAKKTDIPPQELPDGGEAGQVLTRTEEGSAWSDLPQTGMKLTLLWENASPASAFANQNIQVADGYEKYLVVGRVATVYPDALLGLINEGGGVLTGGWGDSDDAWHRQIYNYGNGLLGFYYGYKGGSSSNAYCYPIRIYGITGV